MDKVFSGTLAEIYIRVSLKIIWLMGMEFIITPTEASILALSKMMCSTAKVKKNG